MAPHALGTTPEDPVCLVEACRKAIEWILITHTARGRLVVEREGLGHSRASQAATHSTRPQNPNQQP